MTRKKVKLAFITNDSARKATYKKRKRGLLKKMDELTTLCDVKACAVLYSPYESKPVVWPGTSGAREVISSFKRLPEMEKVKKMVSQEEFLRQRVSKAHEQLRRQQKENREKVMVQVMYECLMGKSSLQGMSLLDLSDLGWVINQQLNEINKRVVGLKKNNHNHNKNNNINNNSIDNIINNNTNNKISNDNNDEVYNLSREGDNVHQNSGGFPAVMKKTNNDEVTKVNEGLEGQNGEFDEAMQMQMMMQQPWSSFMDMMGASMATLSSDSNRHHHHDHHSQEMEMGIGGLLGNITNNNGENNCASTSNGNGSMNMMMMMGQFGDYHQSHGVNPSTMWSNHFFR